MKLECKNLTVRRGHRTVLSNLSFTLKKSEILLLRGPNGSGKTTLIRTIAGFLRPATGEIYCSGASAFQPLLELCHFVGHVNGTKPSLTVKENLTFWARFLGSEHDATSLQKSMDKVAGKFELTPLLDIPTRYLSAGQQRRVGLARLLLVDRPIWLLDEPTVSLDAQNSKKFAEIVTRHAASGGLAVIATHTPLGIEVVRELHLDNVPLPSHGEIRPGAAP